MHGLPLNGVYFVKQNSSYTVDYTKLAKAIKKSLGEKMNRIPVLEAIKVNLRDCFVQDTFLGRVPIVQGRTNNIFDTIYVRGENYPAGLDIIS